MSCSAAKILVLLIQYLVDNILKKLIKEVQNQISEDKTLDFFVCFKDLGRIVELIQVIESNGYENIITSEIIEKLIYCLNLFQYINNRTNEQVEYYYDEQAETKVFPKINIKNNIKNNIQRDSNSDFSPWDSDTSTSQIFA